MVRGDDVFGITHFGDVLPNDLKEKNYIFIQTRSTAVTDKNSKKSNKYFYIFSIFFGLKVTVT